MKKIFIYFFALFFILFIFPILCTNAKKTEVEVSGSEENTAYQENKVVAEEKYKNYATIKVKHTKDNTIQEVNIDEYLYGVVAAEMPVTYEIEALKAQAVVARTYTIYKIEKDHKHEDADICDSSSCCQAWISKEDRYSKWGQNQDEYWNKIVEAVNSTKGKIITYNNEPINALFHSNSGGVTEMASAVWGGTDLPYLQSVETSGEQDYSQYQSEVTLEEQELLNKLKGKYPNIEINFENQDDVKVLEFTSTNRARTVKFGNTNISSTELRSILGLRSTNFEIERKDKKITFKVKGYGHGVGMSQTGADTLAKENKNYEDIIRHFYSNVEIKNINDL